MVIQQERRRGRRLSRWSVAELYPEHDAGLHQTPTNRVSFTPTTSWESSLDRTARCIDETWLTFITDMFVLCLHCRKTERVQYVEQMQ